MTKKYRNPPLIEAVCEFRLVPDSPWDLTVHGLIYEKVKRSFPHKEQRLVQEVEVKQTPKGIEQEVRLNERSFFFTNDKTMFVQIGQHLLAINCLRPYPGWQEFQPKIEEAFIALTNSIDVKGLARIGYRAINRIEIPLETANLADYFEFRPFLGTKLPRNTISFIVGCVLPFFNERDACKIQLTTGVPETPNTSAFLLDIDYSLAKLSEIQVANTLGWVEDAHNQEKNIFEGCITDGLRRIFQEEE